MNDCQRIISRILPALELRESEEHRRVREDSWMTTEQIRQFLLGDGLDVPVDVIEACLFAHEVTKGRSIRSATYPDTFTLDRLWGHVSVVGPGDPEPMPKRRRDPPRRVEGVEQFPGAPTVFLSYAYQDTETAFDVARTLSGTRTTAWLYESAIEENDLIFEAVQTALRRADVFLGLITPFSIASLWVRTEIGSAEGFGLPIRLAIPTAWPELVTLLAGSSPSPELIHALEQVYKQNSTRSRVEKYGARIAGLMDLLRKRAHEAPIVVIGAEPTEWRGVFNMTTLSQFAQELATTARTEAGG